MKPFDRLVLEAVENCGPDATVLNGIWEYVEKRRRWWWFLKSVYPALLRLENQGYVTSMWDQHIDPETLRLRGWHRRRLYNRTTKVAP